VQQETLVRLVIFCRGDPHVAEPEERVYNPADPNTVHIAVSIGSVSREIMSPMV